MNNSKIIEKIKPIIKKTWFKTPYIKNKQKSYIEYVQSRYDYSNKPSIICSNCIGGIIYHNLGMPFLSPTINLWMPTSDFIKFIRNIREYVEEDLVLVSTEKGYPIVSLKDIIIHFNHYKTFKEAKEKWNERKKRIDYDNLYIIMGDNGLNYEEIKQLKGVQCKRLIVFTAKDYSEFDYTFQLKRYKNFDYVGLFALRDIDGFREFEKAFDYVAWINGESKYRNMFEM